MSILNFWKTTEADVLKVITSVKNDTVLAAADINAALNWLAGNSSTIAADVQAVLSIVETLGVATNPKVAVAVNEANLAVTALNAFSTASNAGQNNAMAVVQGYVALQQANAAVADAKAASAASVVSPPPAIVPAK